MATKRSKNVYCLVNPELVSIDVAHKYCNNKNLYFVNIFYDKRLAIHKNNRLNTKKARFLKQLFMKLAKI